MDNPAITLQSILAQLAGALMPGKVDLALLRREAPSFISRTVTHLWTGVTRDTRPGPETATTTRRIANFRYLPNSRPTRRAQKYFQRRSFARRITPSPKADSAE